MADSPPLTNLRCQSESSPLSQNPFFRRCANYADPVYAASGQLKPRYALAAGAREHHPEGVSYDWATSTAGKHVMHLVMKLMILAFVRTSELIDAPWSEFDLERAGVTSPKECMKMKTPYIVPLSRQAIEMLEFLRDLTGNSDVVFPKVGKRCKTISNNTIVRVQERMGSKGEMTGRGFRGMASTILHEPGYQNDDIELQLAHPPGSEVSVSYNHVLQLEPRAKMMQDWADFPRRCTAAVPSTIVRSPAMSN